MPKRATSDILPPPVRTGLVTMGRDIAMARRRRRLTTAMMAERLGISRPTYLSIEKGLPGVSIGAYAMALYTLGLGTPFTNLADPAKDDLGMILESEHLPLRVHAKKEPRSI